MRIKLDENLPEDARLAAVALGHDVDTVLDEALGGAADPDVLAAATREDRFVVTAHGHGARRRRGFLLDRPVELIEMLEIFRPPRRLLELLPRGQGDDRDDRVAHSMLLCRPNEIVERPDYAHSVELRYSPPVRSVPGDGPKYLLSSRVRAGSERATGAGSRSTPSSG